MTAQQDTYPPPYQPDERMMALLKKQAGNPLTIGDFEGRENETFTIVDEDQRVEIELVKVTRLKPQAGVPCQVPGSLLFRVPKEWSIPQRLYRLSAEGQDDIVLFLATIVGRMHDPDHHYLQTIFS